MKIKTAESVHEAWGIEDTIPNKSGLRAYVNCGQRVKVGSGLTSLPKLFPTRERAQESCESKERPTKVRITVEWGNA